MHARDKEDTGVSEKSAQLTDLEWVKSEGVGANLVATHCYVIMFN